MAAPTLDNTSSSAAHGAGTAGTCNFSTTLTNDIVVLIICTSVATGGTLPTISVAPASASLGTFTRRGTQLTATTNNGPKVAIDVFYKLAASVTASEPINWTYSSANDEYAAMVLTVNGCDTTTPWDTNASLPATNTQTTGSTTVPTSTAGQVSTTSSNIFLIQSYYTANSGNVVNNETNAGVFTGLLNVNSSGGTDFSRCAAQWASLTSAVSSQTEAFGTTQVDWATIVDALKAPGGGGGSFISRLALLGAG